MVAKRQTPVQVNPITVRKAHVSCAVNFTVTQLRPTGVETRRILTEHGLSSDLVQESCIEEVDTDGNYDIDCVDQERHGSCETDELGFKDEIGSDTVDSCGLNRKDDEDC